MIEIVNGTTAPWLIAALGVLVLLTLAKTYTSWRQVKRSPYFFLRQQAERKLRGYLWATVVLVALLTVAASFDWEEPADNYARRGLLAHAKPVEASSDSGSTDGDIPVIALDSPQTVEISSRIPSIEAASVISTSFDASVGPGEGLGLTPVLPEEFDQFEPEVELAPDTEMTPLVFSTEVNDDYDPVSPRRIFGEGFFTIYATFDYEGMADGMEWAWIWRRDGEVVNGGNELWAYGDEGPGWIYYEPPEGFSPGSYTLEVWVNGELFRDASLTIESEVANQ